MGRGQGSPAATDLLYGSRNAPSRRATPLDAAFARLDREPPFDAAEEVVLVEDLQLAQKRLNHAGLISSHRRRELQTRICEVTASIGGEGFADEDDTNAWLAVAVEALSRDSDLDDDTDYDLTGRIVAFIEPAVRASLRETVRQMPAKFPNTNHGSAAVLSTDRDGRTSHAVTRSINGDIILMCGGAQNERTKSVGLHASINCDACREAINSDPWGYEHVKVSPEGVVDIARRRMATEPREQVDLMLADARRDRQPVTAAEIHEEIGLLIAHDLAIALADLRASNSIRDRELHGQLTNKLRVPIRGILRNSINPDRFEAPSVSAVPEILEQWTEDLVGQSSASS